MYTVPLILFTKGIPSLKTVKTVQTFLKFIDVQLIRKKKKTYIKDWAGVGTKSYSTWNARWEKKQKQQPECIFYKDMDSFGWCKQRPLWAGTVDVLLGNLNWTCHTVDLTYDFIYVYHQGHQARTSCRAPLLDAAQWNDLKDYIQWIWWLGALVTRTCSKTTCCKKRLHFRLVWILRYNMESFPSHQCSIYYQPSISQRVRTRLILS